MYAVSNVLRNNTTHVLLLLSLRLGRSCYEFPMVQTLYYGEQTHKQWSGLALNGAGGEGRKRMYASTKHGTDRAGSKF